MVDPVTLSLAIGSLLGGVALLKKRNLAAPTATTPAESEGDSLTSVLEGEITEAIIGEVMQVIDDPSHLQTIFFGGMDEERDRLAALRADLIAAINAGALDISFRPFLEAGTAPADNDYLSIVRSVTAERVSLATFDLLRARWLIVKSAYDTFMAQRSVTSVGSVAVK